MTRSSSLLMLLLFVLNVLARREEIISVKLGNLCVAYVGERMGAFGMFGRANGLDDIGLFSTDRSSFSLPLVHCENEMSINL